MTRAERIEAAARPLLNALLLARSKGTATPGFAEEYALREALAMPPDPPSHHLMDDAVGNPVHLQCGWCGRVHVHRCAKAVIVLPGDPHA